MISIHNILITLLDHNNEMCAVMVEQEAAAHCISYMYLKKNLTDGQFLDMQL